MVTAGAGVSAGTTSQGTGVDLDGPGDDDGPDVELDEYNAYLAMLNKEVKSHGKWHGLR